MEQPNVAFENLTKLVEKIDAKIDKLNKQVEIRIDCHHLTNSTYHPSDQSPKKTKLLLDIAQRDENWFQISWKVLVKQTVDDYENEFDRYELINSNSSFHMNESYLNKADEYSFFYDRPDERRKQRWEFYLRNSPNCIRYHWFGNFMNLVKRIEESEYSVEEFCKALTILYKEISFNIFFEVMSSDRSVITSLSSYQKLNYVVPLLLADYTKTEVITKIFNELGVCK